LKGDLENMNGLTKLTACMLLTVLFFIGVPGCGGSSEPPSGEESVGDAAIEEHPSGEQPSGEAESEEHPSSEHPTGEHPN
jgi:hypothetical protein